jgi:hypothetical protein
MKLEVWMVLKTFYDQAVYHLYKQLQLNSSVVLFISNDDGSHCLIVTSTSVHCITFSTLPVEKLRNLVYLIQAAASQSKIWRSSIEKISHNTGAFPPAIQETLRNWMSLEEKWGVNDVQVRYLQMTFSDLF